VATTRFVKGTFFGFAGSGKTVTVSQLGIGLQQIIGDGKPVAFFDTETGSDFVIPLFEEAGIELVVAKTRAFSDLLTFMDEAASTSNVVIIDSITHVWNELKEAYERKLKRRHGLELWDWGKIKPDWARFTDAMLDSKMHVLMAGRAGFQYEERTNDDKGGKTEVVRTGTKVKAESEFGFEPHLLVEMELIDEGRSDLIHRARVLKDRSQTMNGASIDFVESSLKDPENHVLQAFQPLVDWYRVRGGADHRGIDRTRTSDDMIETPASAAFRKERVAIALEEIKAAFITADLSMSTEKGKRVVLPIIARHFGGTMSWEAVKAMRLEDLEAGLEGVRRELGQHADGYVEGVVFHPPVSPFGGLSMDDRLHVIKGGAPVVYRPDEPEPRVEVDGKAFVWNDEDRWYEVEREGDTDAGGAAPDEAEELGWSNGADEVEALIADAPAEIERAGTPRDDEPEGDYQDGTEAGGSDVSETAGETSDGAATASEPDDAGATAESDEAPVPPEWQPDPLGDKSPHDLLNLLADSSLAMPTKRAESAWREFLDWPESCPTKDGTPEARVFAQWAEREGFDIDDVGRMFSVDGGASFLRIVGMRRPRSGDPQIILAKVAPDFEGWERVGMREPALPRLVDWMRRAAEKARAALKSEDVEVEG
jgi:hypothetical protein